MGASVRFNAPRGVIRRRVRDAPGRWARRIGLLGGGYRGGYCVRDCVYYRYLKEY